MKLACVTAVFWGGRASSDRTGYLLKLTVWKLKIKRKTSIYMSCLPQMSTAVHMKLACVAAVFWGGRASSDRTGYLLKLTVWKLKIKRKTSIYMSCLPQMCTAVHMKLACVAAVFWGGRASSDRTGYLLKLTVWKLKIKRQTSIWAVCLKCVGEVK